MFGTETVNQIWPFDLYQQELSCKASCTDDAAGSMVQLDTNLVAPVSQKILMQDSGGGAHKSVQRGDELAQVRPCFAHLGEELMQAIK